MPLSLKIFNNNLNKKDMEQLTDIIINVSSPAFEMGKEIPKKYTCDGENINPPLAFENYPENTASLALIMDDPDAPNKIFNHWTVWNIRPDIGAIDENIIPGIVGKNSYKEFNYQGPCPPSGTHRYLFNVYALDTILELPLVTGAQDLKKAMEGHVLAQGQLIGLYSKK